jgi:hypothetical protein
MPGVGRQERTEEARIEDVLAAHDAVPLERVVGPLEDELPDLDEGRFTLGSVDEPLLRALLPEAALPIDTPDLLFEDGGVPFGMELHDDATGLMKVEPFTSDLALRNEDPR